MTMRPFAPPTLLLPALLLAATAFTAPALAAKTARAKAPAPAAAAPLVPAALQVEVGASQTIGLRGGVDKVVVDTPDVVSTRASANRELVITGLRPGHTLITLSAGAQRAAYDVTVLEEGAAKAEELRRRLATYPGLGKIQVETKGDKVVLSGPVEDLEDHERALSVVKGLVGDGFTDLTQVGGERMVAVDIHFYAITDTTLNALGLNFSNLGSGIQAAISGPNTAAATTGSFATSSPLSNAFNLFLANNRGVSAALSALSEVGLSEELAQPTLLVRSGEQADFLAGGEIPIPVPQAGAAAGAITITYKPYGVRLEVAPVVLSNGRIVLKLAPEVSELDQVNKLSIQGFSVPALLRRSANTTVELGDGESFVIAGLTYATSSQTIDRLPGLGSLPVIGALFRQAQSSGQRQQLIIVATPHLVRPVPAATLTATLPSFVPLPTFGQALVNPGVNAPPPDVGLKF
jgi:pilus assembly protein CpaC